MDGHQRVGILYFNGYETLIRNQWNEIGGSMGRPTSYQPRVAEKVLAEIAAGRSLRDICAQPGWPSRESVRRWLAKDEQFRQRYDDARRLGVEALADRIEELANSAPDVIAEAAKAGVNENAAVAGLRLQLENLRWLLSKISPRYGDKVELTGAGGKDLNPEPVDPVRIAAQIASILRNSGPRVPVTIDATPARPERPAMSAEDRRRALEDGRPLTPTMPLVTPTEPREATILTGSADRAHP
jgi:hypothetical protein